MTWGCLVLSGHYPGVSVLERLVAIARDRAANRLWWELAHQPTAQQRLLLEDLVKTPEGSGQSLLDRLRRSLTHVSGPGLVNIAHCGHRIEQTKNPKCSFSSP